MKKRTITLDDTEYQVIKKYCDDNSLKIGNFVTKLVLTYIKNQENEKQKTS